MEGLEAPEVVVQEFQDPILLLNPYLYLKQ
jgi:hypothetical protein